MRNPKRVELGCPGHFIGSKDCRFRRHTQVGNYRVSTIGDYNPDVRAMEILGKKPGRCAVGAGDDDFFETMVFATKDGPAKNNEGCGCRQVDDFTELECERYATAGDAQSGHERMVEKYEQKSGL